MYTKQNFGAQITKLRDEYIQLSNNIEEDYINNNNNALETYNLTLDANKLKRENDLRDLDDKYNKILKELERINESYNCTITQINNETDPEIIDKLKYTLNTLPKPENIRLKRYYNVYNNIPKYICRINISKELSKFLNPYFIDTNDDIYTMTVLSSDPTTIWINNNIAYPWWIVRVADYSDIIILFRTALWFNPILMMTTHYTITIFVRKSTLDYKIINTPDVKLYYEFYDNHIVSYEVDEYSKIHTFNYHIFSPNTLDYTINKVPVSLDFTGYRNWNIKHSMYNKNLYIIKDNSFYKIDYGSYDKSEIHIMDFDLDPPVNLDNLYNLVDLNMQLIVIDSLKSNVLTITYVAVVDSVRSLIYKSINLEYDLVLKHSLI